MAAHAQITSIEAIEQFRASLLVYLSKARPTLDEVGSDLQRLRNWIEDDRRRFWEEQIRRRTQKLREAEEALFGAKMSNFRETTHAEIAAVRRAKQAVEEAEVRLRKVKQWCRDYDSRIEPLAKQLEQLRNLYTIEMPKAVAHLTQVMKTLTDYAGITAGGEAPPPGTAPDAPGGTAGATADAAGQPPASTDGGAS